MKKARIIIAVLLIAAITFSLGKNALVKVFLLRWLNANAGAKINIESMDIGVMKTRVGINGLEVLSPSGFPDKIMIHMPEIYVDYDLPAFLRGEFHLEELRLNLKELTIVRDKSGKVNVDSLKMVQAINKERDRSLKREKTPGFRIDLLKLKIGKVAFKNYSKAIPIIAEYNVDIDEEFRDITNPYTFASIVVTRTLTKNSPDSLAEFNLAPLKKSAGRILGSTKKVAEGVLDEAVGVGKEIKEKTTDTIKILLPVAK